MAHKYPEPYSGKNPVPQIATKLTALVNPEKATEAKAAQLQDESVKRDHKQTEKLAHKLSKGRMMRVTDPVTGEELDIRNADEQPDLSSKGENVLDAQFPPIDWDAHRKRIFSTILWSSLLSILVYKVSFFLAGLFPNTFTSTVAVIVPTVFSAVLFSRAQNFSKRDFEDRAWHSERIRGLRAGSDVDGDGNVSTEERVNESAEWANEMLRGVWPIMNPDLFGSLIDILEDIMQSSVPHFVHSVRVSDLGLGSNSARITAIRTLPDCENRRATESNPYYKGEPLGRSEHEVKTALRRAERASSNGAEDEEDDATEFTKQHVNLEVSFAYRGLPSGNSAASKAKNLHLLVEFFLGLRGWWGIKVPVWVEITGAVGHARARLQLISDPPFIKTTMVTLLGLPHITISIVALSRLLPNVMDIPFISGFISSAIDTAVAEYVAPKSFRFDLQRLVRGDDIKKDTDAVGVLVVHIHRAKGVRRMDVSGGSDPYITITYSRLGKPLYSTRIIKGDCNPVFEETAVILVDVNTIRLHEKLSFHLWDSDRMTVDDLLGVAEVDLLELVRNHGQPVRQCQRLSHPRTSNVTGDLEYTVGYYNKIPPTQSLKSSGNDPGIPDDLQDRPEFQKARQTAMNDLEAAVLITPPDSEWPSGILSVQVHEIRDLGVKMEGRERNVLKSMKSREGEKGQDESGVQEEEAEGLPSSYCTISLNDELAYRTRVKPITGSPIFNAGTEKFVKDWRTAHVSVTVKDSRLREADAVLGIVMLKLSDLLVNSSQLTRLYSIEGGLGYGRIRISILFRPVEAKLPRTLLGFDTGTLRIHTVSIKVNEKPPADGGKSEVRLRTSDVEHKLPMKTAICQDQDITLWVADDSKPRDVAVRQRYGSALLISLKSSGTTGLKWTSRKAQAVLWMRDVADNEDCTIELPLWSGTDSEFTRLRLNYSPPDGNLGAWDFDKEKLKRIGTVYVRTAFKPGVGEGHRDMLAERGVSKREGWDSYARGEEAGLRESIGESQDNATRTDNVTDGARSGSSTPGSEKVPNGSYASSSAGQTSRPSLASKDSKSRTHESDQRPGNTIVPSEEVESVSAQSKPSSPDAPRGGDDTSDGARQDDGSDDDSGKKPGIIQRFKDWKQHEKELHRDHRGIMQAKPARTAEWIKSGVEEKMHEAKGRFSLKGQKPNVESEV